MTLTNQDMIDVRRHCGYGFIGAGQLSLMYWRFFIHYNTLEFRLNNLQDEEVALLQTSYLPTLNQLEMQTAQAGSGGDNDTLDTDRAAVWYHNKDEVADRGGLYSYYRKMLCNVMQIPPGPWFAIGGNSVRMVV